MEVIASTNPGSIDSRRSAYSLVRSAMECTHRARTPANGARRAVTQTRKMIAQITGSMERMMLIAPRNTV